MPLRTISLRRPIGSYAKAQAIIGGVIRNRRFQLNRAIVRQTPYLDLGCGPNIHAGIINLDYLWRPGVDVCWDITQGLPFPSNSMKGVFSEHCLEHFPQPQTLAILREVRRVLAPGGRLRVIVPDARIYLRTYARQTQGQTTARFPYQDHEQGDPLWTPLASVNRVFYQDRESPHGHCQMYDFALLRAMFLHCRFAEVASCSFLRGGDPRLLIDTPSRACESLYLEAIRPVDHPS